jgi:hypothetical protein
MQEDPILYLDLKTVSSLPGVNNMKTEEISSESGYNLGNFLFRHGLSLIISDINKHTTVLDKFETLDVLKKYRMCIISCANWLGNTKESEDANSHRADILDSIDAALVPISIGIQASLIDGDIPRLGDNSIRLIRVLANKSKLVSVRDSFSAEVITRDSGVDNLVVTGCPSNLISSSINLIDSISNKIDASMLLDLEPSIAVSELQGCPSNLLTPVMNLLINKRANYICQDPQSVQFIRDRKASSIHELFVQSIEGMDEKSSSHKLELFRRQCRYFTSASEWIEGLKTFDIIIGMRIHGTIAGLQSETPSLLIVHDARTLGLSQRMSIPSVSLEGAQNLLNCPRQILDFVRDALPAYQTSRREMAKTFLEFLRQSDLNPTSHLIKLAR